MYKALYDFAVKNNLIEDKKYVNRKINCYFTIDNNGDYINVELFEKKDVQIEKVGDFGTKSSAGSTPNLIVEKYKTITNSDKTLFDGFNKKHNEYLSDLNNIKDNCLELNAIFEFVTNAENKLANIPQEKKDILNKVFQQNYYCSFIVNDKKVEDLKEFWNDYFIEKYNNLYSNTPQLGISCITGEEVELTQQVKSLLLIMNTTHKQGDYIFPATKANSLSAYGLNDYEVTGISEKEDIAVKNALNYLLRSPNHYDRHFKLVHWYDTDLPVDDLQMIMSNDYSRLDELAKEKINILNEVESVETIDMENDINMPNSGTEEDEKLSNLIKYYIYNDKKQSLDDINLDNNFHTFIYTHSGKRSRMYNYKTGSVKALENNIKQFYKDSELYWFSFVNNKTIYKEKYLTNIFILFKNLLNERNNEKGRIDNIDKKIDGELGKYKNTIYITITENKQFESAFIKKVLMEVEKDFVAKGKTTLSNYQILKIYLSRLNVEDKIMSELNVSNTNFGYLFGRMFAIYERINYISNENSDYASKYFKFAVENPLKAFYFLSQMSQHHIAKEQSNNYSLKLLSEISNLIKEIPEKLSDTDKAFFTLGYLQQKNEFFTNKNKKGELIND